MSLLKIFWEIFSKKTFFKKIINFSLFYKPFYPIYGNLRETWNYRKVENWSNKKNVEQFFFRNKKLSSAKKCILWADFILKQWEN